MRYRLNPGSHVANHTHRRSGTVCLVGPTRPSLLICSNVGRQRDDVEPGIGNNGITGQCVWLREVAGTLRRVGDVVHVLHIPLVLAGYHDPPGVRRPPHVRTPITYRASALALLIGTGLVEAIRPILLSVGRQLRGVAPTPLPDVQVVILREGFPDRVRRNDERTAAAGAKAPAAESLGRFGLGFVFVHLLHGTRVGPDVTLKFLFSRRKLDSRLVPEELERVERKLFRYVARVVGQRHRSRHAVVVEQQTLAVPDRVDQNELMTGTGLVTVPEAILVQHPIRPNLVPRNQQRGIPGQ